MSFFEILGFSFPNPGTSGLKCRPRITQLAHEKAIVNNYCSKR